MIRNSNDAWGWGAITLHWVVALLVVATFALGLWMGDLPRPERPYWYGIHASLGITLMLILFARIVWALLNPTPAAVAGTPPWQHKAARFTHLSLYVLTLATVLFGWFLASVKRTPIVPPLRRRAAAITAGHPIGKGLPRGGTRAYCVRADRPRGRTHAGRALAPLRAGQ
jgi:cytochrome b561